MRVILINPWDQSVREADYSGDYRDWYRLLSGPTLEGCDPAVVQCADVTSLSGALEGHDLVVDDIGLLVEEQAYFELCGRTFAGRAIVMRDDERSGTDLDVAKVAELVTFLPLGSRVRVERPVVRAFDSVDELFDFFRRGEADQRNGS